VQSYAGLRWLRGAVRLVAMVVIPCAIAAIPYPLYVTEECVALPVERRDVRAQIEGLLAEILVDEGAVVHRGDVIARLDTREIDAALSQATAEVERLSANLAKLRAGNRKEEIARLDALVESRADDLHFAELDLARRQGAFADGVGSAEQVERAEREVAVKRAAQVEILAEQRLVRAGFRREEIAIAEAELDKAHAEIALLEKQRSLHTITAPIDGQVTTPRLRERLHEKIAAGGSVCELADTKSIRFEVFVPERHGDIVALRQPTTVKIQAYPLRPFRGEVVFIAPATEREPRNGEKVIRVETIIDNSERLLRPGMTGYAEVTTGRRSLANLALRRLVRWIRVRFLI
jgi:HlyD family secretion protein